MNSHASNRTAEHRLVDKIKEWTGSNHIGDDCAILAGGLLVSIDSLAEGTHFSLETTSLVDLGWKSAAVNLSDIAAMAGRPRYLLVSLGFSQALSEPDLAQFYEGLTDCARQYRVKVVGGDLVKSPHLAITVTVLGDAHEHGILRRDGAKPGDVVVVTGDFGASAAGLHVLTNETRRAYGEAKHILEWQKHQPSYCVNRHRRPFPRLCEGWALNRAARGEGALMDASDGLADALVQIALASSVRLAVDLKKVPVHQETLETAKKAGRDPLDWVLYGGEDYELVACISEDSWKRLCDTEHNPFTAIGVVEENASATSPVTITLDGKPGPELDLTKCFQHACPTQQEGTDRARN